MGPSRPATGASATTEPATSNSTVARLVAERPEPFPFAPVDCNEPDEPASARPVPVTVIFLDLFGERRAHFSVSRQAFFDNPDVLCDRIEQFLRRDSDTSLHDVSAIRAEASDDAGLRRLCTQHSLQSRRAAGRRPRPAKSR
jgi:hypothetical protein